MKLIVDASPLAWRRRINPLDPQSAMAHRYCGGRSFICGGLPLPHRDCQGSPDPGGHRPCGGCHPRQVGGGGPLRLRRPQVLRHPAPGPTAGRLSAHQHHEQPDAIRSKRHLAFSPGRVVDPDSMAVCRHAVCGTVPGVSMRLKYPGRRTSGSASTPRLEAGPPPSLDAHRRRSCSEIRLFGLGFLFMDWFRELRRRLRVEKLQISPDGPGLI